MSKYDIPFDIAIEYTSADLKRLKFQDLQRTASSIFKEARKRIKELEKAENNLGTSPALEMYKRYRDQPYSARYKSREQLMKEISEAESFLSSRTSNVDEFRKDIEELDQELGFETTKDFRNKFYDSYNKWKEANDIKESHGASRVYFNTFKREVASAYSKNYGTMLGLDVIGFASIWDKMKKVL